MKSVVKKEESPPHLKYDHIGSGSIQALDSEMGDINFNSSRISLEIPTSERKNNLTSLH